MSGTNRGGFNELTLNILRIVAALLFMQHGVQKLFGALGGNQVESLMNRFGVAGILEFGGGLLLAMGLFTRPVAFILAGEMAVAYFTAHLPQGFWPIMNQGELAMFYCFTWLFFFANGPGRYSLDAWRTSRTSKGQA